jgi:hypothetical protein
MHRTTGPLPSIVQNIYAQFRSALLYFNKPEFIKIKKINSHFNVNICLPSYFWIFCTTVLQLLHSLEFDFKPRIICDGFLQHSYFNVKKEDDNSPNFAAGGIINRRTHHNSLCRDKNKNRWPVMSWFTISHVTLLGMCELSPAPTLVT